jgi:hypothetical protein
MITALKFCARAILICWKRHTPWFTKFEFEKFFSLFYIISCQRSYIYKKPDTNRCFPKLRAISNLFSFFYTPCRGPMCGLHDWSWKALCELKYSYTQSAQTVIMPSKCNCFSSCSIDLQGV